MYSSIGSVEKFSSRLRHGVKTSIKIIKLELIPGEVCGAVFPRASDWLADCLGLVTNRVLTSGYIYLTHFRSYPIVLISYFEKANSHSVSF